MSQSTADHGNADVIDLLAGLAPESALSRLRDQRPQARENAQLSFEALLEPADPGSFVLAERYAVASFVALLHGFEEASAFYTDLLEDESSELLAAVRDAAAEAATSGPFGHYRESGLASESTDGERWSPTPAQANALGDRLAAALVHAHLLVFRPREASPEAMRALVAAGWGADEIVSLSQLVAFLSFQLRVAWGLRVLALHPAPEGAAR